MTHTSYSDPNAVAVAGSSSAVAPASTSSALSSYVKRFLATTTAASTSYEKAWITVDVGVVAEEFGLDGTNDADLATLRDLINNDITNNIDNIFARENQPSKDSMSGSTSSAFSSLSKLFLVDLQMSNVAYVEKPVESPDSGGHAEDVVAGIYIGVVSGVVFLSIFVIAIVSLLKRRQAGESEGLMKVSSMS